ncbi:MAG: hypothetical protein QOF02_593 [Blastocatellia bacterium]|jgi:hypothetical protein|nr:hypothetical protein [Blastocatellia bacterium]
MRIAIAALMISGAAICAAAQSGAAVKKNVREHAPAAAQEKGKPDKSKEAGEAQAGGTPTATPALKQNMREQNTRESETTAAQTAPAKSSAAAAVVRYSYEFSQPAFFIRHIVISHDENGRGEISFERKDNDVAIVDPIALSPAALVRVKALWDALRFMDSTASYQADKQFPHLGTMRLSMTRGEQSRVAEFNWTHDENASALVNEYRRVADQAIFIFNITLSRQNQPLEAPKLLDELDRLYKRNGLSDPQQLAPLLQELANDERIPLIARNHATRLLKQIQK